MTIAKTGQLQVPFPTVKNYHLQPFAIDSQPIEKALPLRKTKELVDSCATFQEDILIGTVRPALVLAPPCSNTEKG